MIFPDFKIDSVSVRQQRNREKGGKEIFNVISDSEYYYRENFVCLFGISMLK